MSSIIGIDIGDMYTKAATLDNGVIENLLFNQSNRMNHSYITFKDKGKRLIGSESYNIFKNNMDNTICSFNNLIHNIFLDNDQEGYQGFNNKNSDDNSFIPVKKIGDKYYHLQYIFLAYLELTIKSLNKSRDCEFILSLPGYFNICDLKFLSDSLSLRNYNYQLISQEYAISLDYGFYKSYKNQFLQEKNVLFVNIGYNSSQLFITNFNNQGMKIINTNELNLGGNHFTNRLYDYISSLIFKKYDFNTNNHPKKKIMVLKECERVKKQLSTLNSVNFIVDCLTDEITINEVITRELFNKLTENLILEILNSLNQVLEIADLNLIDSVELLGGGMRIPKIKESITERIHKDLSFTLNAEESVSKGCVIYGAINSPLVKNANYQIEKYFYEPIEMFLSHYNKKIIVLEKGFNALPLERTITIPFNEEFNIKFQSGLQDFMANYNVNISTSESKDDKVEIVIRFDLNNQIEIIDYNVIGKTKIDIVQLYQSYLDELDKKEILDNLKNSDILENKINFFYEAVNVLESIFYNNELDIDDLTPEEILDFNKIKEFIKNNIVDEEPDFNRYDEIINFTDQVKLKLNSKNVNLQS
jgi:molecular chaperone DnaK (HSP70)